MDGVVYRMFGYCATDLPHVCCFATTMKHPCLSVFLLLLGINAKREMAKHPSSMGGSAANE